MEKLDEGDQFPTLTLNLAGGGRMKLPDDIATPYQVVLFYRGHWWPYCRRQLAGYEALKSELDTLGVAILGASVDTEADSAELLTALSFPLAVEVTRAQADAIGAWWNAERGIVQPSEFLLDADGRVISSTYSSTPIGRIEPGDVIKHVNFLEKRKAQP